VKRAVTDLVDVTRKISEEGIKVNDGRRSGT
jgi:hypothetical protein